MRPVVGGQDTSGAGHALLETHDIRVRYGGVEAVRGASVAIAGPQIVGLIGPNGAGKSSLLAAIGGQAESADGRVLLAGSDITRLAPHRRARLGIVRTFQTASVFDGLTVFENLLVAAVGHEGATLRRALFARSGPPATEADARERAESV